MDFFHDLLIPTLLFKFISIKISININNFNSVNITTNLDTSNVVNTYFKNRGFPTVTTSTNNLLSKTDDKSLLLQQQNHKLQAAEIDSLCQRSVGHEDNIS